MPTRESVTYELLLVDNTGRLFREGKAAISHELAGILDRLGSHPAVGDGWADPTERTRRLGFRCGVPELNESSRGRSGPPG